MELAFTKPLLVTLKRIHVRRESFPKGFKSEGFHFLKGLAFEVIQIWCDSRDNFEGIFSGGLLQSTKGILSDSHTYYLDYKVCNAVQASGSWNHIELLAKLTELSVKAVKHGYVYKQEVVSFWMFLF